MEELAVAAPKFDEERAKRSPQYLSKYTVRLVRKVSKHYPVESPQIICCRGDYPPRLHVVRHVTKNGIKILPFLVYSPVNWKLSQEFWDEQLNNLLGTMKDILNHTY